ncbi:hypothetical protein R50072_12000 [Simiduia litorea]|uniref:helix-turn-helix domain-containing protein n=1 Tax=Simiduia litorea TaxID=1435348 RepID=UPI0036F1C1EB
MIVKKLREQRSWSQEQLAQIAGLSLRTIQRVEAGNKASLETLKSLAAVFEVDIGKLTAEIVVIDKDSTAWQAEPWYIRWCLYGVRRRSHMLAIEYSMIVVGIVTLLTTTKPVAAAAAFLGAYINTKLLSYIDQRAYW